MPQLSLYLEEPLMDQLRSESKARHISLSKYVSNTLQEKMESSWPSSFWEIIGSVDDDTFVEPEDQPFTNEPIEAI